MNPQSISPQKMLTTGIIVFLVICPLFTATAFSLQLTQTDEYRTYVHDPMDSAQGKFTTYIEKPIFPVMINNTQIPVGGNWTIICPLQADHSYHIYCFGTWVNTSFAAKTDYDIYVYDPQENLASSHTEAAGLPEHLGTTVNDPFFVPAKTGNYTFVLLNDLRESQGDQQATFMIIENLECDKWHTSYVEGKDDNSQSRFYTSWAYEFQTNATKLELYAKIPDTLDMYEGRLYLMNNDKSIQINNSPLPWELGLYGNVTGGVGGYNFETDGYRGVAYASCEYMGQDMYINYTAAKTGAHLYQLVLIGEKGSGNVDFLLKTKFENITLAPVDIPRRVYPGNTADVSFASSNSSLESAQLSYSVDNWTSSATIDMKVSNQTCAVTLPGQTAGTTVNYEIQALDILRNSLQTEGSYTVKEPLILNITAAKTEFAWNENITIHGVATTAGNVSLVKVQFSQSNSAQILNCTVGSEGNFTADFKPVAAGLWAVTAAYPETETVYRADSQPLSVTVSEPPLYIKYSLYLIISLVAAVGAGLAVWFFKFRNQ
jgi:hypothetical protein